MSASDSDPVREALAKLDFPVDDVDEIVKEFLIESSESLDSLDRNLVALEEDPSSAELLAGIFRTVHTIKGSCGFLGFGKLEAVTHAAENLLGRLRDGRLRMNPDIATALLSTSDAIRAALASIEATREEGAAAHAELIAHLTSLSTGDAPATAAPVAGSVPSEHVSPTELPSPAPAPVATDTDAKGAADSTIRVDVGLLDKLLNLAGELVLARNEIVRRAAAESGGALAGASQQLDRVTTEIQERLMKTRMQPVSAVWDKLPRVVRDVARSVGKQVRLEMEGRETELDRTVIEAIKDPLTHILRNAIDHGIEPPDVRRARSKPVEGRILLRAFHGGGRVHLEVSDDGKGLDLERIRHKAIERGVISSEQAARMTPAEIVELVFVPGFSMAEKVTNISGRGVGMDVVRSNIEKIGGAVDLDSRPGEGLTISVRLPLTLAIIPALIVGSAGERFAIPQTSVLELIRVDPEAKGIGIETLHSVPVYRLRDTLLPVVYLERELGLAREEPDPKKPVSLIVLQTGGPIFGLVVDTVLDSEEIVVKPLGEQLKGITAFAGATILGEGRVALILDVVGLARAANVIGDVARQRTLERSVPTEPMLERRSLLLVAAGSERLALPLAAVRRLEELRPAAIEQAGDREVVQYRGAILPVVRLDCAAVGRERMSAVICDGRDGSLCLVVDRILDVVENTGESVMAGTVVVQERVTTMVDVDALVQRARGDATAVATGA